MRAGGAGTLEARLGREHLRESFYCCTPRFRDRCGGRAADGVRRFAGTERRAVAGDPGTTMLRASGNSSLTSSATQHAATAKRGSRIDPAAAARPLLYAAGDVSSYVLTTNGKVVGNITQTGIGTCSDKNGDVFFTTLDSILEFATVERRRSLRTRFPVTRTRVRSIRPPAISRRSSSASRDAATPSSCSPRPG